MKRKDGLPKAKRPPLTMPWGNVKNFVIENYNKNISIYSFAKNNNLRYSYVKKVVRNCGLRA